MQPVSGMRQRWHAWHPSRTQLFWSAAGAVLATFIIGFGPAGWVTGGSARAQAEEAADAARHQLAAAVCTQQFMRATDARTRLENLKSANWYERDEIVSAGGWATMPDRKEPNIIVADMCAARLAELRL